MRPITFRVPILMSCLGLATAAAAQDTTAPAAPAATGAATAAALVPADVVDRIIEEGIDNSHAMHYLDALTNGIGHRLTGSHNYDAACRWALAEFRALGLEAELEPWATWKTGWDRGQWSGRVTHPVAMELQVATPAWTAGTRGATRGRLLVLPESLDAFTAMGEQVRGAFLFDLASIPDYDDPDRERYGGVPEWVREHAVAAGVAGIVTSSIGTPEYPNRIRVFADRRSVPWLSEDRGQLPEVVVRYDQAERLRWLLTHNERVDVEFDIRNRYRKGPIELHNVVAELRGTEKPDEVVYVCGHLDSWHQATGTTDNGTGTTSTMEAARILTAAGAQPKRTIRFALWGGEEQGLLGSAEHVKRRRTEMDKVSCVLNHDTGTNWAYRLSVTEAMLPLFERVMAPVMQLTPPDADHEGPVFSLRAVRQLRGGGGSDHASFTAAGVPGLAWGLTGRSDYFGYTWHTQWDSYDVAIPEYQRHTATVIALTALGVANLEELLPREGVVRGRGRGRGDATQMFADRLDATIEGLAFTAVRDGGMAATAGIRTGDTVVSANGKPVKSAADIFTILREGGSFTDPIALVLRRGDEEVEVSVAPFADFGRRRGGTRRER